MTQANGQKLINWSLPLRDIPQKGIQSERDLTETERRAVKAEAGIHSLKSFRYRVNLKPEANGQYSLWGEIKADLEQQSAISLDVIPQTLEEKFELKFTPHDQRTSGPESELDIEFEDEMIEYYEGETLDIGQIIYEYFIISLEQFPKKQGEVFNWADPDIKEADNPFAVLKTLQSDEGQSKK